MQINFKLDTVPLIEHRPDAEPLIDMDVEIKEPCFNPCHVFTRCEKEKNGQSWLGILLYVIAVCINFVIGYQIYRLQDIHQEELTNTELFGDICTVGFLAFTIITFQWNGFEKRTCLHKSSIEFWKGFGRFCMFELGTISATYIYGAIQHIPLFQSSLNSNLTHEQYLIYVAVFTVIGLIVIYWCCKLFNCVCTRKYCKLTYSNKLVFVRLLIVAIIVNVGSYLVCKSDSCDYHPHHWFYGLVLVVLSSPVLDNWLDFFLHGVFWMFIIESIWNYNLIPDKFFI